MIDEEGMKQLAGITDEEFRVLFATVLSEANRRNEANTKKPPPENPHSVPSMLRKAAGIYEERGRIYGDNYKVFGEAFNSLFGRYLVPSADPAMDFNRLGVLVQIVSKLTRYAQNVSKGGHDDSLDDLVVYTMMLKELDMEARVRAVERERGR